MPEKSAVLPKHTKLMTELHGVGNSLGTIYGQRKKLKMTEGVKNTIAGLPRLIAWFKDHQAEYEELVASMGAKPKAAKAAG